MQTNLPPPPGECNMSLAAARDYCRRLAETHYENFRVVSWLVPRDLRPHFHAVYAYCRIADDLADETGDAAARLAALDEWELQLRDCYAGRASHPAFIALSETIREFDLPIEPFQNLLVAFRRDQRQTRYETFAELLDYCRCSADPVGEIVLRLGRCYDEANARLSSLICSGLQLVNFWQDVARDYDQGRIYIPRESWRKHGYDEADFAARRFDERFRGMLVEEVTRAETMLADGLPLARLAGRLGPQIELFARGGLAIARGIRRVGFNVWRVRPTVSKWMQLWLLARCAGRRWFARGGEPQRRQDARRI